ncbi:MAG: hypothetical protein H6537_00395 [Bacteroidales bacterium]|nr:hypothetical protein [Bacteroidales bacterium]HRX31200.1 hypothetical protein [Tenuifilaceae bacterium]
MSLKDKWKNLTPTEKGLIAAIILLILLIVLRWTNIAPNVSEGFKRYFTR